MTEGSKPQDAKVEPESSPSLGRQFLGVFRPPNLDDQEALDAWAREIADEIITKAQRKH